MNYEKEYYEKILENMKTPEGNVDIFNLPVHAEMTKKDTNLNKHLLTKIMENLFIRN